MAGTSKKTTAVAFRMPTAAYEALAAEASEAGVKPQDLARQMVLDGIGWVPPAEPEAEAPE